MQTDEVTTAFSLISTPAQPPGPSSPPPLALPDISSQPATNPTRVIQSLPPFPVAAIVAILLVLFILVIASVLVIRKVLKNKGILGGDLVLNCPVCCKGDIFPTCRLKCLEMAEKMDCSVPSCQVWLDSVCPTKQQCSMTCSKVWSCYCCLLLSGACQDVQVCPSCSAMECPDCSCCGDCCHCTLKVPECSHVTCLCFECGKAP